MTPQGSAETASGIRGPPFVPATNLIVATVTTGDPNCRATSWSYRLDTQSARSFLAAFLTLP